MGFCPGWIRSVPAKAAEVSTAIGVKDHALLFEQLLLVASCADFALCVDDTLPGHRWPWRAIAQGSHGIAHLTCCHRWPDHRGNLPVGGDAPRWNVPDDFIDTVVKCVGHGGHPYMSKKRLRCSVSNYTSCETYQETTGYDGTVASYRCRNTHAET